MKKADRQMKKADRQIIFNKYGGKCAYCGCDLVKGWHVDELQPCRRRYKTVHAHYINELNEVIDDTRLDEFNKKFGTDKLKWVPAKRNVFDGYEHPERLTIDNQMPACPSCNINKHSESLESFRKAIMGYMKHLNEINTQYKIAKRYGLVIEKIKPIVFYFESITQKITP